MRQMLESRLVHPGQQAAGVGIAHVALLAGDGVQARDHRIGDATGAVSAAREPDGVDAGIVGELDEGVGARPVVAGEMTVFQETCGMEDDGDIAVGMVLRHPGLDGLGALFSEARTGADDADLEAIGVHVRLLRRFCDPLLADRPDPLF